MSQPLYGQRSDPYAAIDPCAPSVLSPRKSVQSVWTARAEAEATFSEAPAPPGLANGGASG